MDETDDKTRPARVGVEALEVAKVAAGIKGMSVTKYLTGVLLEAANRDIEEWYRTRSSKTPGEPKPASVKRAQETAALRKGQKAE